MCSFPLSRALHFSVDLASTLSSSSTTFLLDRAAMPSRSIEGEAAIVRELASAKGLVVIDFWAT